MRTIHLIAREIGHPYGARVSDEMPSRNDEGSSIRPGLPGVYAPWFTESEANDRWALDARSRRRPTGHRTI
jgi:hypothetical protein